MSQPDWMSRMLGGYEFSSMKERMYSRMRSCLTDSLAFITVAASVRPGCPGEPAHAAGRRIGTPVLAHKCTTRRSPCQRCDRRAGGTDGASHLDAARCSGSQPCNGFQDAAFEDQVDDAT